MKDLIKCCCCLPCRRVRAVTVHSTCAPIKIKCHGRSTFPDNLIIKIPFPCRTTTFGFLHTDYDTITTVTARSNQSQTSGAIFINSSLTNVPRPRVPCCLDCHNTSVQPKYNFPVSADFEIVLKCTFFGIRVEIRPVFEATDTIVPVNRADLALL